MKIEILKENLKSGLSVVERIIGRNISLPILDNVLMDTEDSFLNLISTNLETTIKIWILAKIVKKGKAVTPAKFLSNYVSLLPNEKITLELKEQKLYVDSANSKTQIQGYNPWEFPIIPKFLEEGFLEVDNRKFFEGFSQVVDIATQSKSRPEISGIYFYFSKNTIKIVATDSFRLAEKNIILEGSVKKEFSFILPQRPAKEIMNILSEREGVLKIYFSGNQVLFEFPMKELKHPQVQIFSRLIEGEYPNYQDIVPNKFKATAVVKREEVIFEISKEEGPCILRPVGDANYIYVVMPIKSI